MTLEKLKMYINKNYLNMNTFKQYETYKHIFLPSLG